MAAITPAVVASIYTSFKTEFQRGYNSVPNPWSDEIATEIKSSEETTIHVWSGHVPRLREWVGNRELVDEATFTTSITNRLFERTLKVARTKVEDDQWGALVFSQTKGLAYAARKHYDYLMADWLKNANSTPCYDGANFFSTTHPISRYGGGVAAGTQANYFTSKGLTYDNYVSVRAAMRGFKGEGGLPLGVQPDTLLVPPALEGQAKIILEAEYLAQTPMGGQTNNGSTYNVYRNTAKIVVADELSGNDDEWYLLCTKSHGISPLIKQVRQPYQLIQFTKPTDPSVFNMNEFLYGVSLRGNVGGSLWWLAAKCKA